MTEDEPDEPDEPDDEYAMVNHVDMRPGTEIYVSDRGAPNWDAVGVIDEIDDERYRVNFGTGYSALWYRLDQLLPTPEAEQSEPARARRAASKLRVFLCHASDDKPRVRELHQTLTDAGFRPWLDEVEIPPGAEWDPVIRDAVRDSHVVLVCLSDTSVTKAGYVQKEMTFALDRADEMPEGRVYIIPAKLEPGADLPRRLSKWQSVDISTPAGHQRLVTQLRKLAPELAG